MNVVCIGSGYVGGVTGTAFAVLGHKTVVVDIDQRKVDVINAGKSPIYEPGLDELIEKYIGKTLFATGSYEAVKEADVVFIGVGTPANEDGTADLTYIKLAAQSIGRHLNETRFTVIVNKSTVPVGTADLVSSIIEGSSGLKAEQHFSVRVRRCILPGPHRHRCQSSQSQKDHEGVVSQLAGAGWLRDSFGRLFISFSAECPQGELL
jgi:UDPglucose 6-dehydrogenase